MRWGFAIRVVILSVIMAGAPARLFAQPPQAGPPFGSFDTPADRSLGLTGSVAITGWALDDGVVAVDIQRDAHPGDPSGAVVDGRVFIGTASFVSGARPDIASAYAPYPNAARAGWGYLMLTRGLIWDGAGMFRLYAIARDGEGNKTELGSKTISIDNSVATKPFGAIDSPAQGGTVSGLYPVTGWVLTPNAGATIPATGVRVSIDGAFLQGVPSTSDRADITAAFAAFNTSGAGRGLFVDTTQILNGLHTISWLVTDSAGQADGIGSRYFVIANPTFSSGQFAVGTEMAPGRYFTDPVSGCYWERQAGFTGSSVDVLANDSVGFDAAQLVVDVRPTDAGFRTDPECGTWSMAPVRGLLATIVPGAWLVNSQIPPGTYRASAASGCYWERLRNFDGTSSAIIANQFSVGGGPLLVTIEPGDVGFSSEGDCGAWTRVAASLADALKASGTTSSAAIEANRRAHLARRR